MEDSNMHDDICYTVILAMRGENTRLHDELLEAHRASREETALLEAAIDTLTQKLEESTAIPTPPSPEIAPSTSSAVEEKSLQQDIQDVLDAVRNTVSKRKRTVSNGTDITEPRTSTTCQQPPC
jgi:hypothetical protein